MSTPGDNWGDGTLSDIVGSYGGRTRNTIIGRVKKCSRLTRCEIAFLVLAMMDLTGVIVFTILSMSKPQHSNEDFTFGLLILINAVFSVQYVFNGIYREKAFQLVMLIASLIFLVVYCVGEFGLQLKTRGSVDSLHFKLVRLILVLLGSIATVPLAIIVIKNCGFLAFEVVGANGDLQDMYKKSSVYNSLLVFDFQASVSAVVLVLVQGVHVDQTETIVLAVGLIAVTIWAGIEFLAARQEWKIPMLVSQIIGIATFGYVIWKSVILHKHDCSSTLVSTTSLPNTTISSTSLPPCSDPIKPSILFATIGALTIYCIIHLMVLVMGFVVWRNFGKGLKEKVLMKDSSLVDHIAA